LAFYGLIYIKNYIEKFKNENFKYVYYLLIFAIIFTAISSFFVMIHNIYPAGPDAITLSVDYLKDKVNKDDVLFSNVVPWFGYAFNVKAYCIDCTENLNITSIREIYHPKYIIIHINPGDNRYNTRGPKYKKILDESEEIILEKVIVSNLGDECYIYKFKHS